MAGYTRQDTANNIANGKVVDADLFDSEYNAVEAAFNNSSGHSHDGSAGEGAPITKVGPAQDLVISGTSVLPKTSNTLDLGSALVQFKDAYFDGQLNTDSLTVGESSTFAGDLTASANLIVEGNITVTGNSTVSGSLTLGDAADDTVTFSADVDSHIIPAAVNTYDLGSVGQEWRNLYIDGTANIDSLVADTADVNGGSIDNTAIGSSTPSTVAATTISATSGITGDLTGDVTGTVSDISNHDTDDLSEGSTNLYYTDTRARNAVSATGSLSYNSSTGEFSYTQGDTDTVDEGTTNLYYTDARVQTYISGNRTYGNVTSTGNVIVQGNLTVSGTTTTVNTETINLADNIITLNSNEAGTPSQNGGIEIERGTAANKTFIWDEANDYWTVGSETLVAATFDGNLTGNVTGTVSDISNHDTGDLSEGSNLYYTNARADARIAAASITDLSDANQTVRTTDSPTFVTVNATTVDLGDWTITESSGVLYFATGGTNKMKLDASGNLTVTGNVSAYGTV